MSREIRILHTSDLHLDASFRATGVPSARARERCAAHLEAFDRIVEMAERVGAHILAVAGDLFEGAHARPATARHVAKKLEAWGRPVYIAPGNHDPIRAPSAYDLAEWPANVTVFASEWSVRHVPELGLTVHGRGFTAPEEHARLVEGLEISGEATHVVVAHGSDESCRPDRHHPYRPFVPEELDALPVAYVALGHYHGFSILPTPRVRAVYCGSPIPQGFNESGEHGVVLARLRDGDVEVELLPIPARRFVTVEVDVGGADTQAEVVECLREDIRARDLHEDFLRLRLTGSLPPDLEVDPGAVREALAELAHAVEVHDGTFPEYDLDALGAEGTVRGQFVRKLGARLETATGEEREVVQRAIYFGLDAFAGRPQAR
ncbi:MAG: exonuclease SbcCD subunit D [Candidatus Krumholzibacteriia bacterium]